MSHKKIIEVSKLSKRFFINHEESLQSYQTLRESFVASTKKIFTFSSRSKNHNRSEEFWALKDVSFEVDQGDRIGVIGRNGAGKSTLLKILSRITEPSSGRIRLSGRVASLLEVGTGFHPELTGRENIFLNGAILGMSRFEIKKKFDEIVDFSGVEKFLDTPVKRFSSGMYVRLAFAVAAHLEPEILIVDEVLAVGDAEFQKKCLGKMEEVSTNHGRTVLFVSHNLGSLKSVCNLGLYLHNGIQLQFDNIDSAIFNYLNNQANNENIFNPVSRKGTGRNQVQNISVSEKTKTGQDLNIRFSLKHWQENNRLDFRIENTMGTRLAWISTSLSPRKNKTSEIDFILKELPFMPGRYFITYCLYLDNEIEDWCQNAFYFDVYEGVFYDNFKLPPSNQTDILLKFDVC